MDLYDIEFNSRYLYLSQVCCIFGEKTYKQNECKECMEWNVTQSMHLRLVTNSLSEY